MARPRRQRILSGLEAKDFIGRAAETERLISHADSRPARRGLTLLAAPGVGTSELLKHTYDRLFVDQKEIIPFYFAFRRSETTAAQAAERFVYEFILQTVAFRRQDDSIIAASPDLAELSELAAPADGKWIDRLVESIKRKSETAVRPFVRDSLAAPGRAASYGTRVLVLLDDVHNAAYVDPRLFEELRDVYGRAEASYVFAARRRFPFGQIDAGRMLLDPLSFADTGRMIESTADRYETVLNDQSRDLIAVQLDGNLRMIADVVSEAATKSMALDSFQNVEQAYADSVFGGGISRWLDRIFADSVPPAAEEAVLDVLYDTVVLQDTGVTVDAWKRALDKTGSKQALELLNLHEMIRITSNRVELPPENVALFDYVNARHRLEIEGENRAIVYSQALASFIRRAPELMQAHYRRSSAIGVREMLTAFDGQTVPAALIDYGKFRDDFKGLPDEEVLAAVRGSADTVRLPKVFFAADAPAFSGRSERAFERDRAALAQGYLGEAPGQKEQIAWIAAEIDSKLEASAELTAAWCDRLGALANTSEVTNFRIWLIAPEGFSPEALTLLAERDAYGSSRKQFELLRQVIGTAAAEVSDHEYEIVLPMGEDAELIAANAVEEIARRYNFTGKAINQIKTALVEACINASEHSLSPDQKIYQKFTVDGEKLTITISNRGLRLADRQPAAESEPTEGRRGWGLQLMRRLMDEVTIEDVDDGTRISMIKYLHPPEPAQRPA